MSNPIGRLVLASVVQSAIILSRKWVGISRLEVNLTREQRSFLTSKPKAHRNNARYLVKNNRKLIKILKRFADI